MMIGLPIVKRRKVFKSDDCRHGNPPSRPITPFSATATTSDISGRSMTRLRLSGRFAARRLDCDRRLDVRMRVVPRQREIFKLEIEDRINRRVDRHRRQCARAPLELLVGLLEMIDVEMRVAE